MTSRRPGARFNRGRVAGTAVAGTPADTPAIILSGATYRWLEADMGETLSADSGGGASDSGSGGGPDVVDALADQGPGGYNMAQTTSARPRKELRGWNGRPCWAGDGVNDRFQSTGTSFATNVNGVNQAYTRWIAFQPFIAGATLIPWSCGANATTPFMELFLSATNVYTMRKNAGANVDATGGTSTLDRIWARIECAGATISLVVNGVSIFSGTAWSNGSMTFDRDAIMCLWRSTITNMAAMRCVCDVWLDGTPTADQRTRMDAYFAEFLTAETRPLLVMSGDSHTNTDAGEVTWMTLAEAYFAGSDFINNGVVGDTLVNMLSVAGMAYRYADSNYDSSRVVCAYGNHYGANDIEGAVSRTAVQVRTDQTAWATGVEGRHAGVPKIACTLHQISGLPVGKEAERVAYNTDMRANYLSYGFTHLLDKDLIIPELPSDTSVFEADGKHLNATGEGYLFSGRFGVDGMQQILEDIGFV